MSTHEDPMDDDAAAALAALRQPRQPPPELEAQIMALISGSRAETGHRETRRWVFGALAMAAAFVVGVWLGVARPWAASAPNMPASAQFMLLLYEDAAFQIASDPAARRQEYVDWARRLGQQGLLVGGEELAESGQTTITTKHIATQPLPTEDRLAGYFVIAAQDANDAARIAGSCPHLVHGGRIVVRQIVPGS